MERLLAPLDWLSAQVFPVKFEEIKRVELRQLFKVLTRARPLLLMCMLTLGSVVAGSEEFQGRK